MEPITPDSQGDRDFMNLKGQTKGDRVLLFLVASVIGLVSGVFVVPCFLGYLKPPTTIGGFLFFEIMFSVTLLCALSAIWAVFQPWWLVSLLSGTALKVYLVVFVVFLGTATWLLLQFVV